MDIDLLSKMVKELILDRDEVTLPGVGTFVAETVPASFSDRGYTINPPYRKLSFRQRLSESGDNCLIDLYIKSNPGVDPDQAQKIVTDFLSEMKVVLKAKKNIVFPGLGRLRSTKENNFFFVADEDLDIWPAGFGLEPISLKAHEESPEEISAVIGRLKQEIEPVEEPAEEPVAVDEPIAEEPIAVEEPITEPAIEEVVEEPVKEEVKEEVAKEELKVEPVAEEVKAKKWPLWAKALLWFVVAIVVLIVLYAVAARIWPDFFDSVLYTREELEILNF